MMTNQETGRRKRPAKRSDPRSLRRFLQEFSWLLSAYEDLDFQALGTLFERQRTGTRTLFDVDERREKPSAVLVGTLPDLFTDENLFPSNEDIADFAFHALGVDIPRWSKKSKYEIIGHVVCHTSVASEKRLEQVVSALEKLTLDRDKAKDLISSGKAKGMSWNELIQQLIFE